MPRSSKIKGRAKKNTRSDYPSVKDISIDENSKVSEIFTMMKSSGGFQARYLADAVDILEDMCRDKDCTKFLSFPAAIISTGTRGVIKEIVKRKLCDAVITTCGTLDHDLARSFGFYQTGGEFTMDDVVLEKKGYHRLGNVLISTENYGPLVEEKVQKILSAMYADGEKSPSTEELCRRLGQFIGDEDSILYWAAKNKIPVFVPGITDGAVGSQCWLFYQTHRDFRLDLLRDEQSLSDLVYSAKKSGAFMLGGGISKHHTIWWNQFRGGLDYAVYITSANEQDGSLSGAQIREAISWGKVAPRAKQVTVFGEVTSLLPFVVTALIQRLASNN
jgi:deoxyhypusine synthase